MRLNDQILSEDQGGGAGVEKGKWAGLVVAEGADPGSWGEGAGWEERKRKSEKATKVEPAGTIGPSEL